MNQLTKGVVLSLLVLAALLLLLVLFTTKQSLQVVDANHILDVILPSLDGGRIGLENVAATAVGPLVRSATLEQYPQFGQPTKHHPFALLSRAFKAPNVSSRAVGGVETQGQPSLFPRPP